MAKKDLENPKYLGDKNVQIENIGDLATKFMKIFGANTNLMRHIPSLADGLKPGERRILWAMYHDLSAKPNGEFKKVAKIVGDVIGNYHPHGNAPVYETLVKLAQYWGNIQTLIQGLGNFGSPQGDPAAADRYIKARLSRYAWDCFFDEFSVSLVNMKPSYEGNHIEPEYLPAKYPNVLINNTFGIGYGASSGLPTYNLKEVLELTLKLKDDPAYENVTLIPDSPTGADIVDEGQFEEVSETGQGKFKMRGEIEINEERNTLHIRSVPLQVASDFVKRDIIDLFKQNKIQGIRDIKDHSNKRNGIHIEIFLKKEIDPVAIKHLIFTKTQMEKTFPVNFKLIDDYQDFDYNVRTLLLTWIDFRRETKRRLYNHLIVQSRERQHILETILMIFTGKNAEKSLELIRKAESKKEIMSYLMNNFKITSLQADMIAGLPLSAFSKESIARYKKEKEDMDEKVQKYESIARSPKKIDKLIHKELEDGIEKFGQERKSKIITISGETKVRNTNHVVVFTMNGFVKKLPEDSTSIGNIGQNDHPIEIIQINNLEDILIFDQQGKISKLPVQSLQSSTFTSEGDKLSNYCTINGNITSITRKPTTESLAKIKVPVYFVMVTKNGVIKKTLANNYVGIKGELLGMIVKEGDELKSVRLMAGDKDVLVYTNNGFGVRFPTTEIRETARMSQGVKAIEIANNEFVIGMDIVNDNDKFLFALTDKGTGKKCTLDAFQSMDRASKPLRIISMEDNEQVILIKTVRGNEKFRAFLKNTVEEIDISTVDELPRMSKGRKLIGVKKGEVIIDIKEVK